MRDARATVQFQNPSGDRIKEIAVVGDDQNGAFVIDQVLLQPADCFGVEVVGRFVEQQHVGRIQQKLAERDTAFFTT